MRRALAARWHSWPSSGSLLCATEHLQEAGHRVDAAADAPAGGGCAPLWSGAVRQPSSEGGEEDRGNYTQAVLEVRVTAGD